MSQAEKELFEAVALLQKRRTTNKLDYYQPYEFQKKFHNVRGHLSEGPAIQKALMAANQIGKCNSIAVYIETDSGRKRLKDIWGKSVSVLTYPDLQPRKVLKWIRKPAQKCYRVTMKDGQWFECPAGHLVLTDRGYVPFQDVYASLPECVTHAQGFLSGVRRGIVHWWGKVRGWWGRCFVDSRLCGGQLLSEEAGVQVFAPLQDDAQLHIDRLCSADATAHRRRYSLSEWFSLQPNLDAFLRLLGQCGLFLARGPLTYAQLRTCSSQESWQSRGSARPVSEGGSVRFQKSQAGAYKLLSVLGNEIVSVVPVGFHTLYDMEVEDRHNYIAGGVVHHNSYGGAMEVAYHLTGKYPAWWTGINFLRAPQILVSGMTNESTRDICQNELFGEPSDESKLGTGAVPKSLIGKKNRKAGVPNAYDSVFVKHVSGLWSKCFFRAYEQGWEKFMGIRIDFGWCDEEPPEEVWSQMIRATLSTRGHLMITFTPENGITKVVYQFMSDIKKGQALVTATWDDAPHMVGDRREQALQAIPSHQREMRSKGIPLMGSGLVFQVPEVEIAIDDIKLQDWWPRIAAVDFGIDHKFACVWIAWDRDSDCAYVYDVYAVQGKSLPDHVSAIKRHGDWIPVVWPHDGLNREKSSGKPLAQLYREEGANMRVDPFSNPPAPGQKEGEGGNSVEYGIEDLLHRMQTGRFKVVRRAKDFWDEFRMYHRKDGKIVAVNDDVMSATRYAALSLRFAVTRPVKTRRHATSVGVSNW